MKKIGTIYKVTKYKTDYYNTYCNGKKVKSWKEETIEDIFEGTRYEIRKHFNLKSDEVIYCNRSTGFKSNYFVENVTKRQKYFSLWDLETDSVVCTNKTLAELAEMMNISRRSIYHYMGKSKKYLVR